jgi:hypothetical protein
VEKDARATGRLAENGNIVGVTAERNDVSLHPLECELLIHDPIVAGGMIGRFSRQCWMGKKSQCAQAVIDRHDNHVATVRQAARIEVIAIAGGKGASMDPHHNGARGIVVANGHIHVQEQAIFAGARGTRRVGTLRTMIAELRRIKNVGPRSVKLRRLPPQISYWRGRIGDAEKLVDLRSFDASDTSLLGDDNRVSNRNWWPPGACQHQPKQGR